MVTSHGDGESGQRAILTGNDTVPTSFTQAQLEAIAATGGPLLVVAGPGAGKTAIMVHRAKYLVHSLGIPADKLLITTFTNKAADELYDRLYSLLGAEAQRVHISTIHSFCQALLRRFAAAHPWGSAFEILDAEAQFLFVYARLKELGLSRFPKSRLGEFIEEVLSTFNLCTEENVDPAQLADAVKEKGADILGLKKPTPEAVAEYEAVVEAYGKYLQLLEREKVLDFGMLQKVAYSLLKDNPEVRRQVREQYRYLMVDEYQDTNRLQALILQEIAGEAKEICAVGDDDQSIYRFRGASLSSFRKFDRDYPGARLPILLDVNFRATPSLVSAASTLIKHNADYQTKVLKAHRQEPDLPPILIHEETAADEAERVVQTLKDWWDRGLIKYDEVALLFRSVKYHAEAYIETLQRLEMPYAVVADGAFFERPDIIQLRNLIIFCGWKRLRDLRALEGPILALSDATVEILRGWQGDPAEWSNEGVLEDLRVAELTERQILQGLAEFRKQTLNREGGSLLALLYKLLAVSGYVARNCKEADRPDGSAQCQSALMNLALFSRLVANFERNVHAGETYPLSEYFRSLPERSLDNQRPEIEGEAVRIMTVHQAKGLEFPVVVIGSAMEGRFPGKHRPRAYPVPPELRSSGDSDNVEEHERDQRRLFYVGMTRAENILVIGASDKVAKRGSGVSRFINEVGLSRFGPPNAADGVRRELKEKHRATVRKRLSYSALHSYMLCPRQYLLLYECGFAVPQNYWFNFGTMLHMALEVLHRKAKDGEQIDTALVETIWHEAWRPGRNWEKEQLERAEKLGLEYLHRYAEHHKERFGRVHSVEEPVDLPVGESFIVTGRMDLLCLCGDGLEVIDFKARSRKGLEELRPELQIQTYGLAVQKKGEARVSRITLHLLGEPPRTDLISSNWTPAAGEEAERRLNTAADGIARNDFRATPGPHCRLCDFRSLCPHAVVEAKAKESNDEIPIGAAP